MISFENGYRTIIGEHGLKLSAEEKFKLLIIRSLIRNSKFVIIDEVNFSKLIFNYKLYNFKFLIIRHHLKQML